MPDPECRGSASSFRGSADDIEFRCPSVRRGEAMSPISTCNSMDGSRGQSVVLLSMTRDYVLASLNCGGVIQPTAFFQKQSHEPPAETKPGCGPVRIVLHRRCAPPAGTPSGTDCGGNSAERWKGVRQLENGMASLRYRYRYPVPMSSVPILDLGPVPVAIPISVAVRISKRIGIECCRKSSW